MKNVYVAMKFIIWEVMKLREIIEQDCPETILSYLKNVYVAMKFIIWEVMKLLKLSKSNTVSLKNFSYKAAKVWHIQINKNNDSKMQST